MTKDLSKGEPWKEILLLSLPLLLGNVFQASYNMADTIIVGKFVGVNALAGVGVASTVFNLINALLIGLSIGSSIVISQLFGAKKYHEMSLAMSTILIVSVFMALILTALGQVLIVPLLNALKTPTEDMIYAKIYLRYTVSGLICSIFYNQFSGILRGLGNTKVPLYILILCCALNIILSILFVLSFDMGVAGVALGTVISEAVSAVVTYVYIRKTIPYLFEKNKEKLDVPLLKQTLSFGLPIGLQQCSISLGHILLVNMVNTFGTATIAAYTAGCKVDMFAVMPMLSISSAVSTFVAQNKGAEKYDRMSTGTNAGVVLSLLSSVIVGAAIFPTRASLISLFLSGVSDPDLIQEVIFHGCNMLLCTSLFYWLLAPVHIFINSIAGAGLAKVAMITMICMMALRLLLAAFMIHVLNFGQMGLWIAFPAPWLITVIVVGCYYRKGSWKAKCGISA